MPGSSADPRPEARPPARRRRRRGRASSTAGDLAGGPPGTGCWPTGSRRAARSAGRASAPSPRPRCPEDRRRHHAAVARGRRLVDQHEDHDARLVGGHEADERADAFRRVAAGTGVHLLRRARLAGNRKPSIRAFEPVPPFSSTTRRAAPSSTCAVRCADHPPDGRRLDARALPRRSRARCAARRYGRMSVPPLAIAREGRRHLQRRHRDALPEAVRQRGRCAPTSRRCAGCRATRPAARCPVRWPKPKARRYAW